MACYYSPSALRRVAAVLAMLLAVVCQSGYSAEIMPATSGTNPSAQLEEVVVWAQRHSVSAANNHPSTLLLQRDLSSINITTTEDVVKFEPSLVVRRRFIGDANGVMGIRGANMFQTSRSMVFADGVPLHYLLQSRWNGAPRWTMVSASEIAQVEVLYGPFSAEYSGNAMGGVVLIESAIPQQREVHADASYFSQQFSAYGFDETLGGYKTFFSYGDKLGDLSVYLAYNHLAADSQPQTYYHGASVAAGAASTPVSGAIVGNDERGNQQLWFGDTGRVESTTNNYKLKVGYEAGAWQWLLNIAYEDRLSLADAANSYVVDAAGTSLYSGNVVQDNKAIRLAASRLGTSDQSRDSLSTGLRLRGPVGEAALLEVNLNNFSVLRDQSRSSLANPADPAYTPDGQVTEFGTTGWQTADAKLTFDNMGIDGLQLVTGLRHEQYKLNMDVYQSRDYASAEFTRYTSRSGGETRIQAAFAQLSWQIDEHWDGGLGGRFESFSSASGYYSQDLPSTPGFDLVQVPDQSATRFSPKFSLGFHFASPWYLAYSFGRAYRFPIVEELFSQYQAYNSISIANPALQPEAGLHHNLMLEHELSNGFVRLNLFQESVRDVIESQSETLPGGLSVRTFIPLDQVDTLGVELVLNSKEVLVTALDIRFNLTYTDASIQRNRPDPSIEGNVYPRLPAWRGNLLATYHFSQKWHAGLSLQYASNSFGRNDNKDLEQGVYGAQDGYTRIGLKTNYQLAQSTALSLGVDNLTNNISYVAHPWPGRTYYASLAYDL